jgi:hypothetical protein
MVNTMTDLSPDALAVICAAQAADQDDISSIAAATLRALVLQMEATFDPEYRWPYIVFIDKIAKELENQ